MRHRREALAGTLVLALFAALFLTAYIFREEEWVQVLIILALGGLMLLWAQQWQRTGRFRQRRAREMACLIGQIVPRHNATSDELKRLGKRLSDWWAHDWAGADPETHWIDQAALNDLLAGELPQPFGLRILADAGERMAAGGQLSAQGLKEAIRRAMAKFPQIAGRIPDVGARAVFFGVVGAGRAEILDRLREVIPDELVEDVLVENC
jgi:hypothetical protein